VCGWFTEGFDTARSGTMSSSSLVGVYPGQGAADGDEPGLAREDAIEAGLEGGLGARGGIAAVGLEVPIEPPDQCPDPLHGQALAVVKADGVVDQALDVEPKPDRWPYSECSRGPVVKLLGRISFAEPQQTAEQILTLVNH